MHSLIPAPGSAPGHKLTKAVYTVRCHFVALLRQYLGSCSLLTQCNTLMLSHIMLIVYYNYNYYNFIILLGAKAGNTYDHLVK